MKGYGGRRIAVFFGAGWFTASAITDHRGTGLWWFHLCAAVICSALALQYWFPRGGRE